MGEMEAKERALLLLSALWAQRRSRPCSFSPAGPSALRALRGGVPSELATKRCFAAGFFPPALREGWAWLGSNQRPCAYQAHALTN